MRPARSLSPVPLWAACALRPLSHYYVLRTTPHTPHLSQTRVPLGGAGAVPRGASPHPFFPKSHPDAAQHAPDPPPHHHTRKPAQRTNEGQKAHFPRCYLSTFQFSAPPTCPTPPPDQLRPLQIPVIPTQHLPDRSPIRMENVPNLLLRAAQTHRDISPVLPLISPRQDQIPPRRQERTPARTHLRVSNPLHHVSLSTPTDAEEHSPFEQER